MKISTKTLLILVVFVISAFVNSNAQSIIYVDNDAAGANDGSSWTNAFTKVYEAIDAAATDDQIWVAEGVYYPEINATLRLSTFTIAKQISLFGGFNGTETELSQRDFNNNLTILSGDVGVADDISDNAYHVIDFEFANTDNVTIDGFIIEDGNASPAGGSEVQVGGGISLHANKNKTITNCTFRNNTAWDNGGAVDLTGSEDIMISDCHFYENDHISGTNDINDTFGGGAISISNSGAGSIVIDNCIFENNTSAGHGGAVYADNKAIIRNSLFRNNESFGHGGAIFNPRSINNCLFESNESRAGNGGAIEGGLYNLVIQNSLFTDNVALNNGGAIHNTSQGQIGNCTFVGNISHSYGGAISDEGTSSAIVNSVFAGNKFNGSLDNSIYNLASNPLNVTYSCTPESIAGVGNITDDPGFVNDGTYYLAAGSPCIDAGNGDVAPETDIEGNPRHDDFGARNTGTGTPDYTDMGAYEFQGNSALNGTYSIGVSGDFNSFAAAVDSLVVLGISDSVTFLVESGIYNEQLVIPEITGASDSTYVIFQSASGDSTDVVLTYASTMENENYTVKLDGADFITFRNMTLRATGSTYARIIEVAGSTKHNSFLSNRFEGMENVSELVYNATTEKDSSIIFSENYFLNGKKGLWWNSVYDISISDNMFYHQSDTALFVIYGTETSIYNNLFYSGFPVAAIELLYNRAFYSIEKNKIYLKNGGKGITANGSKNSESDTSTIINNYVYLHTTDANAGIEVVTSMGIILKSLHNTVHIAGDNSSSVCFKAESTGSPVTFYSYNNNYVNMAGGVTMSGWYTASDYNNLFSSGQYLRPGYETLENIQSALNWENNSVSVNPHFEADTSWIPRHPALNNSGTGAFTDSLDIESQARNTDEPDMGASEFTPSPSPISGNFTIGGTAPDYETIAAAVDDMIINGVAGPVNLSLENNLFAEQVRIPQIAGASEINTITFESTGSDTAMISSNGDYTLWLDGADYCIFNRLKIVTEENTGAATIKLGNGATNNQFNNNIIMQESPSYSNSSYLIYSGSTIDGNNIISSNSFKNSRRGIILAGDDAVPEVENKIENNTFENIEWQYINVTRQDAINITGNLIKGNINAPSAITVNNSENGLIANNMINIRDITGAPQGIVIQNSSNFKIFYNTVRLNSTYNSSVVLELNGQNIIVKNNILFNDGIGYAIVCDDDTGFESDHNVLFSNSSLNKTQWLGSNLATLEDWQNSSGNDVNSIFYAPEFVSDDDLHTNDLQLNAMGTPLAEVTVDFDGEPRDESNPDIGADEMLIGNPMAGDYYIGATREFKTFNEAVENIMQVGVSDTVIFLVDPGIYNEQVIIPEIPLSSAEKPITFQSVSGNNEDVVLEFEAGENDNYVVKLDNAQYITIRDLTINSTGTLFSTAIYMINGTSHIKIENNILTAANGINTSLIKAETGNDFLVSGNTITGGFNGIDITGVEGNPATGNIIINNSLINQYHAGIYMQYQKWQQISKNRISHPDPIENVWIGIDLYDCTGEWDSLSVTANNMIDYNATRQSAGIAMFNCTRQHIVHNNINVHGSSDESRSLNLQDGCSNIYVKNNILSNKAGGVIIYAPDLSGKYFDYNVLHAKGSRFIYAGGWIDDLAAWNATGQGTHSLVTDPLFVSDSDLHINEIELFGKGLSVAGITEDFDGDARDLNNPTIGADVISSDCILPLKGLYTIGGTGDYESLNDAVVAMVSCGVDGTIVFEIEAGIYNEQVYLPGSFTGYSPADSIIFGSATGNADDVKIEYNATPEKNYVFKVDGLSNFVLQNVTLEASGTDYGRLIEISGGAHYGMYDGNVFRGLASVENNDSLALIYSPESSVDSSCVFTFNKFENGSMAIVLRGSGSQEGSHEISDNNFIDQGYGLIKIDDVVNLDIERNTAESVFEIFEGIVIGYGSDSVRISSNIINLKSDTGWLINSRANKSILDNNYMNLNTSGTDRAFIINPAEDLYLYHNTLVVSGNNTNSYIFHMGSNSCNTLVQKNNVLTNLAQGGIYSILFDIPFVDSDHNNLFTNGDLFGQWAGSVYDNFPDYVASTGLDANSVSADPAFLNDSSWYSRHVLHNNTGIPVEGITTDLDGNIRDAINPDIGAEEFSDVRFTIGDDQRLCADDSYLLDAGIGFDNYLWSTGSASSTAMVDTTGIGQGDQEITVVATINGTDYNDTVIISFSSPIAAPVTDYCFNENIDSIMISAGEGVSYSWSNGKTSLDIYISAGEDYYVTVTDDYGCSSEGHIKIHHNHCLADMNMPGDSTIFETDSITLYANINCSEDYSTFSYSWSTGDTTPFITLKGSELGLGSHTVSCTVVNLAANNCESRDSVNIIVETVSWTGNGEPLSPITVYPNPTDGILFINDPEYEIEGVELYDLHGRIIMRSDERDIESLSLESLNPGMYLLKIKTSGEVLIRRILLK